MRTIRETLLSVKGENETSIQPILKALSALGFHEHDQAGKAFSLLKAERAAGLNVRQQLALTAAIQGALCFCHSMGWAVKEGVVKFAALVVLAPKPGRLLVVQLWRLAWATRGARQQLVSWFAEWKSVFPKSL